MRHGSEKKSVLTEGLPKVDEGGLMTKGDRYTEGVPEACVGINLSFDWQGREKWVSPKA